MGRQMAPPSIDPYAPQQGMDPNTLIGALGGPGGAGVTGGPQMTPPSQGIAPGVMDSLGGGAMRPNAGPGGVASAQFGNGLDAPPVAHGWSNPPQMAPSMASPSMAPGMQKMGDMGGGMNGAGAGSGFATAMAQMGKEQAGAAAAPQPAQAPKAGPRPITPASTPGGAGGQDQQQPQRAKLPPIAGYGGGDGKGYGGGGWSGGL